METVFPASKNSVVDEIPNAARASAALLDPVPPCSMETIVVIYVLLIKFDLNI
jgi:hypothetical protein